MNKLILLCMIFITGCTNADTRNWYVIENTLRGQINCIEGIQYWISTHATATLLVNKDGKPLTCPWSK